MSVVGRAKREAAGGEAGVSDAAKGCEPRRRRKGARRPTLSAPQALTLPSLPPLTPTPARWSACVRTAADRLFGASRVLAGGRRRANRQRGAHLRAAAASV